LTKKLTDHSKAMLSELILIKQTRTIRVMNNKSKKNVLCITSLIQCTRVSIAHSQHSAIISDQC